MDVFSLVTGNFRWTDNNMLTSDGNYRVTCPGNEEVSACH